ncbi:acyltransferase family protein [Pseudarthrobacter scleromae]|uniref:acyltransferase family protein n=1 Tax=Pseudarthrobacter scleromae TaxID=158897 RepID=UPI0036446371
MQTIGGRSGRIIAIDIARALAIIGVVFNHTVDGLVASGIVDDSSTIAAFNRALYVFRMPALAFVLGLFMARAAEKRGTAGYIREKVTFALYIYLVWFVIQTLVEIATSSLKNSPRGWDSLLEVWAMPAHLWFMPFLAVSAVVVSIAAPWRSSARAATAVALVGVGSVLAWGWNPAIFGLRGLTLLVFTMAGATIGAKRLGAAMEVNFIGWVSFGLASFSGFILLHSAGIRPATLNSGGPYDLAANAFSALAATLGIITLLTLAVILSRVPTLRSALRSVGTKTLEIYLAHVIIVAGTRIVLDKMGVSSEVVFILTAMILGIAAPLVLATLAPRLHLKWLFATPGPLGTWSKAANHQPGKRRVQHPVNG